MHGFLYEKLYYKRERERKDEKYKVIYLFLLWYDTDINCSVSCFFGQWKPFVHHVLRHWNPHFFVSSQLNWAADRDIHTMHDTPVISFIPLYPWNSLQSFEKFCQKDNHHIKIEMRMIKNVKIIVWFRILITRLNDHITVFSQRFHIEQESLGCISLCWAWITYSDVISDRHRSRSYVSFMHLSNKIRVNFILENIKLWYTKPTIAHFLYNQDSKCDLTSFRSTKSINLLCNQKDHWIIYACRIMHCNFDD